ncbi:MAG: 50S ribosomal protein L10 [Chloroflexota bacterium]|nr:50S ribosomal protein L10 [Chloroflexota bacterium]
MPTAKKIEAVAELKELVGRSSIMIGAEYSGLTVKEITTLRRALRDVGVDARVVKNKLFRIAATGAGVPTAGEVADGPTMVVFGFGDIVAPAKAITDYVRTARNAFAPRKAFLDGAVVAGSVVGELASLPSREQLIGQLAGAFVSPMQQFVNLTKDSIQSFARLVDARAGQLEGEAA